MVVNFRGNTFSREDVERAMERFDRETRATFRHWKRYSVKQNDKHYPPKELLRLLGVNVKNLSGGERANRSFRKLGFEIGIGEVGDYEAEPVPNEDVVEDAIETALSLEADLEDALALNLGVKFKTRCSGSRMRSVEANTSQTRLLTARVYRCIESLFWLQQGWLCITQFVGLILNES